MKIWVEYYAFDSKIATIDTPMSGASLGANLALAWIAGTSIFNAFFTYKKSRRNLFSQDTNLTHDQTYISDSVFKSVSF